MKIQLGAMALLWGMMTAGGLQAQATQRVQDAVTQLISAGNYTWVQTGSFEMNGRRMPQVASFGATVVDGPTVATIGNIEAVFLERDAAFLVASGWKHVRDLTEADFQPESRRVPRLVIPGLRAPGLAASYVYVPIHDLLRWLVKNGGAFFELDGALASEIPSTTDTYFQTGRLPAASGIRPQIREQGTRAMLSVWLSNGALTKIVIEMARSDLRTGETRSNTRTYTIEFSQIGTTQPKIDPLAAALFPKLR